MQSRKANICKNLVTKNHKMPKVILLLSVGL